MLFNRDVAVFQTGLSGYSERLDRDEFPEGRALHELVRMSQQSMGVHLFESVIKPGDCVVIKPNFVRDWHPDNLDLYSIITHPAVIRAVVDQVYSAMKGEGRIIIADAPMGDTDFDRLICVTGLLQIVEYYRERFGFDIEICDLRKYSYSYMQRPGGYGHEVRSDLEGDFRGYSEVDIGAASAFADLEGLHLLEGTDVGRRKETVESHTKLVNRYLISRTVLDADVIVSVPVLKVHSKVGVTINCKGMVGINGDKNLLPHFRWGDAHEGGDQFPSGSQSSVSKQRMQLGRFVADHLVARNEAWADALLGTIQQVSGAISRLLRLPAIEPVNGNWHGNDTCWRLAADLIRVALYADHTGSLQSRPQRRFLAIVDGIIGGEGNGPLRPTPKQAGVLVAGFDPIAVDVVCARLMGFDYRKIRYLYELAHGAVSMLEPGFGPLGVDELRVVSNIPHWEQMFYRSNDRLLAFAPPPQWAGHIECGTDEAIAPRELQYDTA